MRDDPLTHPELAIRRLYGYVAYRIGSGPDAEDVVSETIERALRYRGSFDERKGPASAWLAAIASHVIADRARAWKAEQAIEPEVDAAVEDFSNRAVRRLDLHECIASLDDRARELLALRYGADLTAHQIAQLLGQRTNTIEVALHRALSQLRELLGGPHASERRDPTRAVLRSDR